jgi:hypothetical protein
MSIRTPFAGAVMIAVAILSFATLLAPTTASAQSPCVVQRVFNNSPCAFTMTLYDAANNTVSFAIAAGPSMTPISLGLFIPIGAQDFFGTQYPFTGLPFPGCTQCFRIVPAAAACCAIICYDQAMCRFTVTPCAPNC